MYLPLLYFIKAVVCRLYEMLYPCICNVVISCWKSEAYDFVICRGRTDMCFVLGSGWKHLDLEQYRISGLTLREMGVRAEPCNGQLVHPCRVKSFREVVSTVMDDLRPTPCSQTTTTDIILI